MSPSVAPKVGQYLYASCSATDYGRILAVGQDENGQNVLDILVYDMSDLLECPPNAGWDRHHRDTPISLIEFPLPWLVKLEVPAGDVILRRVPWRPAEVPHPQAFMGEEPRIVCATPGNGCFRCTKLFFLNDESSREEPKP
jgi:hypothetical protein